MDRRRHYLIGLDTETVNGIRLANGDLDLSQSLVYDIGWAVCDTKGNIYKERSFVVADIYIGYKDLMKSCYYADKLPRYEEEIRNGKRKLATMGTILKAFREDVSEWGIKEVFAHNAHFDYRALNNTIRYLTKSARRYWFSKELEIWDTLKMARVIGKQKSYTAFCDRNGYKTNHRVPQNQLKAEILYRYISGNNDFKEAHTGLEDVRIEVAILAHCYRQHKPMKKKLFSKWEKFFRLGVAKQFEVWYNL